MRRGHAPGMAAGRVIQCLRLLSDCHVANGMLLVVRRVFPSTPLRWMRVCCGARTLAVSPGKAPHDKKSTSARSNVRIASGFSALTIPDHADAQRNLMLCKRDLSCATLPTHRDQPPG